jgi:chromate reductase
MELELFGLCGSLRRGSWNRRLMAEAAAAFGGRFVEGDLRLPLYDGDLEEAAGVPPAVEALAAAIRAADAAIVVTPEYNQSFSGVLKNGLDWISRVKGPSPWRGKPVAILSAAEGRAGGARAQYALRLALTPFRPRLLTGPEVLVADPAAQFDADGRLIAPRYRTALEELMAALRAEALRDRPPAA